ncbi:MAG: class I SAM-dependent methyltransferase [Geminicoccaceae bacterium]|nr:class I SAM-dependent methyltransferase [Geminicoccaceae bacterium]MCS7269033.1 class I SAM-dependent methyltransferase [Geminicoccaceae bacterium]MDW8125465.1 class I SAM-dependent methyltransferase [Geminicoccaceae bacterium]MDW8341962.1 class I SAM-dependent methyltransferase [Geminicoccaceae bacterium]
MKAPGFFLPHRYAERIRPPSSYPELEDLFARAEPRMAAVLALAEGFARELAAMRGPAPEPRLDQDWFPRLDAAVAYALLRAFRPRLVLEIGSGHSTRFLARALRDNGAGRLIAVDPEPRAALPVVPVEHRARLLGEAELALAGALRAGDVLFVDASHLVVPGSDVDLLVCRVLPRLAPGVLVHLHDVFLPDAYPESWAARGYNEHTVVAALLAREGMRLLWASRYMLTRRGERIERGPLAALPLVPGAFETSLWLVA